MKTSNKLLLGALTLVLLVIVSFAIAMKSMLTEAGIKASGQKVIVSRPLAPFSKISVQGNVKLSITPGAAQDLKITGDKTFIELVETTSEGGQLRIKIKGRVENWDMVEVLVTLPELEALHLEGAAEAQSNGELKGNRFELKITSASQADLHVKYNYFSAAIESGAQLEVKGSADEVRFEVSSGASLEGDQFITKNCNANLSSGAHGEITVSGKLDAQVESGASLEYQGNPQLGVINVSSGGNIDKK